MTTQRKTLDLIIRNREIISEYIRQREIAEFAGNGVFCPICNGNFKEFAPYHNWVNNQCKSTNKQQRCPGCNSLERHRLLWKYLHNETDIFDSEKKSLLDFAPDKFFFNLFNTNGLLEYFPCDIKPEQIKFSDYPEKIQKADITNLHFKTGYFDYVLCSHVLEHVENDLLAISELFRVLKPGGYCLIVVPVNYLLEKTYEDKSITTAEDREKAFGQSDHVRFYGRDFSQRLAFSGFKVTEVEYAKSFTEIEIKKFGFDRFERIFKCSKR